MGVGAYSNALIDLVYEHRFTELFNHFRAKRLDQCADKGDEDGSDLTFKITDLLGIFMAFFIICLVAIFARCAAVFHPRVVKKAEVDQMGELSMQITEMKSAITDV